MVENPISFQNRVETALVFARTALSMAENAQEVTGTPKGPSFYDLEQVPQQDLLQVGASMASELMALHTAATVTLPEIINTLEEALKPSPEFTVIQEAHQAGAMSDALYQRFEDAFVKERIASVSQYIDTAGLGTDDHHEQENNGQPEERDSNEIVVYSENLQAKVYTSGDPKPEHARPKDFPNSFTAPDGTVFHERQARYLHAMRGSQPDFPFRRDWVARVVFGDEVQDPNNSLNALLNTLRQKFSHGLIIESYTPSWADRRHGAIPHDWLVVEKKVPKPEVNVPAVPTEGALVQVVNATAGKPAASEQPTPEFNQSSSSVLSPDEILALGRLLLQLDETALTNLSIVLPSGERDELEASIERLSKDPTLVSGDNESIREALQSKLAAFAKDPTGVFGANMADENATYLLTALAGMTTDQVDGLLHHDSDGTSVS